MEADLSGRLRAETRLLHSRAERSPFIARLLAGQTDRASYGLLLRNLHPIYQAMEAGAAQLMHDKAVAQLFAPGLARLAALEADLHVLQGPDWPHVLPVLPAAAAYGRYLAGLGSGQVHLLAAHAYVRYLGDLAGGQQLRGIVARSLQLPSATGTAFYDFGDQPTVQQRVQAFRLALSACVKSASELEGVVAEAKLAFRMHLALFTELEQERTALGSRPGAASAHIATGNT